MSDNQAKSPKLLHFVDKHPLLGVFYLNMAVCKVVNKINVVVSEAQGVNIPIRLVYN